MTIEFSALLSQVEAAKGSKSELIIPLTAVFTVIMFLFSVAVLWDQYIIYSGQSEATDCRHIKLLKY